MIKMENWVLQKYYVMRLFCIAKRSVILFTLTKHFFFTLTGTNFTRTMRLKLVKNNKLRTFGTGKFKNKKIK